MWNWAWGGTNSWDCPIHSHARLGRPPPGIQHRWGTEAVARHKVVISKGFHGPSCQGSKWYFWKWRARTNNSLCELRGNETGLQVPCTSVFPLVKVPCFLHQIHKFPWASQDCIDDLPQFLLDAPCLSRWHMSKAKIWKCWNGVYFDWTVLDSDSDTFTTSFNDNLLSKVHKYQPVSLVSPTLFVHCRL